MTLYIVALLVLGLMCVSELNVARSRILRSTANRSKRTFLCARRSRECLDA